MRSSEVKKEFKRVQSLSGVKAEKTLMHYAAELGFLHVTKTLVKKCPLLLTMTTEDQRKPVKKKSHVTSGTGNRGGER